MATVTKRVRHAGTAGMVAAAAVLMAGAQPAGAVEIDPTDVSVALESMLQADDVANRRSVQGPENWAEDGSDDPIFVKNGGISEWFQLWRSIEPMSSVFDFRFQFPDAESAKAFLDASETSLGEVRNGGERQEPPVNPVSDTRYYFSDTFLVSHNYLMRHENIVAKVYISGVGGELTPDDGARIASAAAGRMITALGGEAPAPSNDPDPSPGDDPVSPIDELRSHIPDDVEADCHRALFMDPQAVDNGARVSLECGRDEQTALMFTLFDSAEGMDSMYDILREASIKVKPFSDGGSCQEGSYDGAWFLDDQEAGRLFCNEGMESSAVLVWSHPASRILSALIRVDGDHAAAFDQWTVAGPR
jgi:hypothetical protein